ncbi:hypothetical protein QBC32DRAFT_316498 [Pseudoneurospora amorphoporcata]|uniref:Uncharacterized protein n=1 Tax=Pseudoneurospora amorphoporcata TaxID=241081 RepID=A0AAN6SE36_9PEZI|nr:hypothetical protein QBC32DRAFT_316498 [Pseudoneurospora amorphoporcata]
MFILWNEDNDSDDYNSEDDGAIEAKSARAEAIYMYECDNSDDELHPKGVQYPGMNVFRLTEYKHDNWSQHGDQQRNVMYFTDSEDDDSDDDGPEWYFEGEQETDAQCWGGGMRIIFYNSF